MHPSQNVWTGGIVLNQIRSFVIRSFLPQIEQSLGFPGVQFARDGLGMVFLWTGRHQLERVASGAGGTATWGALPQSFPRATKVLDAHAARFPPTSLSHLRVALPGIV